MGAPALLASVSAEVPAGPLRERSRGPEDPQTLLPWPPRDASKEGDVLWGAYMVRGIPGASPRYTFPLKPVLELVSMGPKPRWLLQ